MKKVIILGGGVAQIELINTAKRMGVFTIVVGIKGTYPGYPIADRVYYIDIMDKEAVLDIAIKERVDGICMVCSDFGLSTVGYVCDHLNLVGLTENAAMLCANKLAMKERLIENGVRTAKFCVINSIEDITRASDTLCFPVMLKAVDLQGSKGIFKCKNEYEAYANYGILKGLTQKSYCLMEEFIEGEEIGAQAFIYDDNIVFVQPHGDLVLKKDSIAIPIGHFVPLKLSNSEYERIYAVVSKSIKALGLNNCAVNVDLIVRDGNPYIVELTGRAGANGLTDIMSCFFNIDYNELILLMAIGENPVLYWNSRKKCEKTVLSKQLYSSRGGRLRRLEYICDPQIKQCSFFINEGDFVNKFNNSADCIGKVLCEAVDLRECEEKIKNFEDNSLKLEIETNDTV